MKIRTPEPLIILNWPEYKKRTVFERFPLAFLSGILARVLSIRVLYDASMKSKAIDLPVSEGLAVLEEDYFVDQ